MVAEGMGLPLEPPKKQIGRNDTN